MGRYRSRSRSRSYSPRRSRSPRWRRYDEPFDRYRGGGGRFRERRGAPSGLLVRNISLDSRPEDLRKPFERFGPVKDVYLPKNYYTGEPRGFGFVKFRYAEDAAEAKQQMNHQIIGGREISIVFAEENRKTPQEMRTTARVSSRYGGSSRRRSPPRSPRRRYRSYSRSPSPKRYSRDRDRTARDDYYSPRISFTPSPHRERQDRSPATRRSFTPSPFRERQYRSPAPRRSFTPSPRGERQDQSPVHSSEKDRVSLRSRSPSVAAHRSGRSASPRKKMRGSRSPRRSHGGSPRRRGESRRSLSIPRNGMTSMDPQDITRASLSPKENGGNILSSRSNKSLSRSPRSLSDSPR